MPKKTYNGIKEIFNETGCTLLMTEDQYNSNYKNQLSICPYRAACGHDIYDLNYEQVYRKLKVNKRYECIPCYCEIAKENSWPIPSSYKKQIAVMYRNKNRDGLNGKERKCDGCDKWLLLDDNYANDPYCRDNKTNRCKNCVNEAQNKKRNNLDGDEWIKKTLLLTTKYNSKKREKKRGAPYNEKYNYTLKDVNEHKNKNGEFIDVFTGEILYANSRNYCTQLSLDRKEQEKTYHKDKSGKTKKDNCQTTSVYINRMRGDATIDLFLNTVEKIAKHSRGMISQEEAQLLQLRINMLEKEVEQLRYK